MGWVEWRLGRELSLWPGAIRETGTYRTSFILADLCRGALQLWVLGVRWVVDE